MENTLNQELHALTLENARLERELKKSKHREEQWYKLCLMESQRASALYALVKADRTSSAI
ncbi:MAG: hypothetical protein E7328_04060 [Clostridiales bacterium]|nr:hypothetical protein [Clostridiales bacterium]